MHSRSRWIGVGAGSALLALLVASWLDLGALRARAAPAAAPIVVTNTERITFTAAPQGPSTVRVSCPSGLVVTGGGANVVVNDVDPPGAPPGVIRPAVLVLGSHPEGTSLPTRWIAIARPINSPNSGGTASFDLTAYAICAGFDGVSTVQDPSQTASTRSANNDDERPTRISAAERQRQERTNRSGRDDVYTEGNVVSVACDGARPAVVIANRDGQQRLELMGDARAVCSSVQVGDYVTAEGVKESEALFYADDLDVTSR